MKQREFVFADFMERVSGLADRLYALTGNELIEVPLRQLQDVFAEKREEEKLHLAVCGAYSSGKSTLIRFLTGRKDICVGQGRVTDKATPYDTEAFVVVDTPGICAGYPEHDRISLDYMARADLLLYMIPAKGFTPLTEKNFKETILPRYADKTMLVMGRISDEEESNLPQKEAGVLETIGGMEAAGKFRFCMIDTEDYLLGKKDGDEELVEASRMKPFLAKLNNFLRERGAYGKCAALLDVLDKQVAVCREICESQKTRDEIVVRQSKAVTHAMDQYRQAFLGAKQRVLQKIRGERDRMLSLCAEGDKSFLAELEKMPEHIQAAESDARLTSDVESLLEELELDLDAIRLQVSDIENRLVSLSGKFSTKMMGTFDSGKWKTGIQTGLKKAGAALAKLDKNTLVKIVHFFGGKFKPYGATKWTKWLRGAGKAIGPLSEVVGTGFDLYQEKQKDAALAGLRRAFSETEQDVAKAYDAYVETEPYEQFMQVKEELDEIERKRQEENGVKQKLLRALDEIQEQAEVLRRSIVCTTDLSDR
ncbi:MAG: 50S ribosome-binding GTPase [Kiritimatiellae bacterium]|nr:50S ribosome-binding GTPase [Kiritimatiellia bacterium]